MRTLHVIIETAPHNYAAYIEEVSGIAVTGATIEEVKASVQEAISFFLETAEEDGDEIPEVLQGEYELEYHIDVKTFLEVYSGIFTKAGLERLTGVNQKQLWHYANGISTPRKRQRERIESAIHRLGRDLMSFCF